jgi:archaellum component FlaC
MDSDAVRGFQSELAILHKTVGARDKAIDDVNRALVFCNKAIVDLRNSHINRDATIEVLFDRLNKLQAEYETLKTEYENVCLHRNRTPNTTR